MQIWTKYRNAKQKRKSAYRAAAQLWKRTGSAALAALFLYKAITVLLMAPLLQGIWAASVALSSNKFITTDRVGKLFLSPSLLIGILLIALFTAFWNIYEFSILFHALQKGMNGEKCRLRRLIKESFLDIRHVLRPSGWPVLLYSAILLPFTNFFLTSTYLKKLAVPEYIMEVIRKNPLYFGVYEVIFLVGLAFSILLTLMLPIFILEKKGFSEAAGRSLRFTRKRVFLYIWTISYSNIRVFFRIGLRMLPLVLFGVLAALFAGCNNRELLLVIGTAQQAIFFPALTFILEALTTLAACALVYVFYQESLTGSLPVLEKKPDGKKYQTNGKLFVSLVIIGIFCTTALTAAGLWSLQDVGKVVEELNPFKKPTITCHRGYSAVAPENTLPAFQAAIDFGADCVELDVQMTADGVIMVSHDPSLKRCTGVDRRICDMTYDEVRQLDAGSSFSSAYAGTQIPTLQEVIDLCKGKIRMNIEIKDNAKTPELEAETARLIWENGITDEVCVTALSYHSLEKIKAADPQIRTGYILAVGIGNYYELPDADFFSVETTFITAGMVSSIHLTGKTVSAWTVDREEDVKVLCNKRVDDLITGDPEMVKYVLDNSDLYNNMLLIFQEIIQAFRETDRSS